MRSLPEKTMVYTEREVSVKDTINRAMESCAFTQKFTKGKFQKTEDGDCYG